jgi:mono/diheme cytochrome c family protein
VKPTTHEWLVSLAAAAALAAFLYPFSRVTQAQDAPGTSAPGDRFRHAPASADAKNTLAGNADAIHAGLESFADHCANCHGFDRHGSGSIPALDSKSKIATVNDGQLFWFISTGDVPDGMPAWGTRLSEQERWQLVAFLKSDSK